MAIMAVEDSLSLTVVDEAEGIIVIFGGESEGVVGGEGVIRDCRGGDGTGNGTKGGVVVVCSNAISRLKVDEFGHILIAVTGVEKFVTRAALSEKRSRRHRFSRIPHEEVYLRIIV